MTSSNSEGIVLCEISGSHGGEYEDGCFLLKVITFDFNRCFYKYEITVPLKPKETEI
jgi:hypothetical protein